MPTTPDPGSRQAVNGETITVRVAVTEIRMRGADGLGLARNRLSHRAGVIAVEGIVITAHATIGDGTAALRPSEADFLRKPFRLAEAAQAVSMAMDRAAARGILASQHRVSDPRCRRPLAQPEEATSHA
ncbi:MAG: hypothetical protein WCP77_07245 [Roseococcus sp.]